MLVFFSVLYNPRKNALDNISSAKRNGYIPVVYVNEVNADIIDELRDMEVVILGDNQNVGLGKAFKAFEVWADKNGVRKFIYFDQDTKVFESTWEVLDSLSDEAFMDRHVGLVFFSPNKLQRSSLVISSGCVFLIDTLRKIGLHDDSFFVEGVDYEFCLRLHHLKYRIHTVYTPGIDHDSLQDGNSGQLLGRKISYRCYGSKRWGDFNRAHFRLIKRSVKYKEPYFTFFFAKSFVVFNLKEFYSQFWRVVFS